MSNGTEQWVTTLEACFRYGIGSDMLKTWRKWKGFPDDAVEPRGRTLAWHVPTIDAWLKARPISKVGRPPRWAVIVGNPAARELIFAGPM